MHNEKHPIEKLADWEDADIDLEIDQLISRLAFSNVSTSTICHALNMDPDKFEERYGEVARSAKARGDLALSHAQMQVACRGNAQMLIWLGKQRLNQREPKENNADEIAQHLYERMQGKSKALNELGNEMDANTAQ